MCPADSTTIVPARVPGALELNRPGDRRANPREDLFPSGHRLDHEGGLRKRVRLVIVASKPCTNEVGQAVESHARPGQDVVDRARRRQTEAAVEAPRTELVEQGLTYAREADALLPEQVRLDVNAFIEKPCVEPHNVVHPEDLEHRAEQPGQAGQAAGNTGVKHDHHATTFDAAQRHAFAHPRVVVEECR